MMETGPDILGAVASLTKGIITASFKIIGAASGLFKSTIRSISELKSDIGKLQDKVSGLGDVISSLRDRTSGLETKVQLLTQFTFPPETRQE